MKRWMAAILALPPLTSMAFTLEWKDGRSPSKPYAGLPEVNLEETLGYIMFYPNSKMAYPHNCPTRPSESTTTLSALATVRIRHGLVLNQLRNAR